jgi:ABC-type branched-subunit amino acid transport system ATPase component
MQAELENATPVEAVRILAGAGYWYDTFAQLSEMIAAEPGNSTLLEERAALLEQVGLADLTDSDADGLASGEVE